MVFVVTFFFFSLRIPEAPPFVPVVILMKPPRCLHLLAGVTFARGGDSPAGDRSTGPGHAYALCDPNESFWITWFRANDRRGPAWPRTGPPIPAGKHDFQTGMLG